MAEIIASEPATGATRRRSRWTASKKGTEVVPGLFQEGQRGAPRGATGGLLEGAPRLSREGTEVVPKWL